MLGDYIANCVTGLRYAVPALHHRPARPELKATRLVPRYGASVARTSLTTSGGAPSTWIWSSAKIDVWHKKNKFGWTPLTIAEGYRFGNYKPSPVTVEAFHKVMLAAGVTPPPPNWKSAESK